MALSRKKQVEYKAETIDVIETYLGESYLTALEAATEKAQRRSSRSDLERLQQGVRDLANLFDVHVRKAIQYAIERAVYVNSLMLGYVVEPTQPVLKESIEIDDEMYILLLASASIAKDAILRDQGFTSEEITPSRLIAGRGIAALFDPIIKDEFLARIGLTADQRQYVRNYRDQLINGQFRLAADRSLVSEEDHQVLQTFIQDPEKVDLDRINSLVKQYEQNWLEHRAALIGQTMAVTLSNQADYEAVKRGTAGDTSRPAPRRYWHTQGDQLVRPHHQTIPALNAAGVGLRESFQTEMGPLQYPGDPLGHPSNVINCRCFVVYEQTRRRF